MKHQKRMLAAFIALVVIWSWLVLRQRSLEFIGSSDIHSFLCGFIRVFIPFSLGVIISKVKLRAPTAGGFEVYIAVALLVLLLFPYYQFSPEYDILSVLVIFPGFIIIGTAGPTGLLPISFWNWIGRISYPFYLVHWSVIKFYAYLTQRVWLGPYSGAVKATVAVTLSLAVSYFVLIKIDEPLRRRLSTFLRPRPSSLRPPPMA